MRVAHRWFIFFTASWAALALPCCGKAPAEPLKVELAVPDGENADMFWYGVVNRSLHVAPQKGDPVDVDWQSGGSASLDLHAGDQITFRGTDQNGRLLVTGEAKVGAEKKATIALHRVL